MGTRYFTPKLFAFLRDLADNNDREWLKSHKREYVEYVQEPALDFINDFAKPLKTVSEHFVADSRTVGGSLFRIHRDTRFSKDKTPYKTWAAAVISRGGRRDNRSPALYFKLDHTGLAIGGGLYKPDKDDVYRIRQSMHQDPQRLARILKGKRFTEYFAELLGERNKRLPKEFAGDVDKYPFIANKQFYYFAEYDKPEYILRKDLAEFAMRHYGAGRKLNEFLSEALGIRQ